MMSSVTVTRTYELHPNKQMKNVLDRNMDYRRYCWNEALEIWNDVYNARSIMIPKKTRLLMAKYWKLRLSLNNKRLKPETRLKKLVKIKVITDQLTNTDWELAKINPSPSWRKVRDIMVENKQYWQYYYSSRILQLAVQDLGKAFQNFFNHVQKRQGLPKFSSRFNNHQSFKTDRFKIKHNQLYLDQPRCVKKNGHH